MKFLLKYPTRARPDMFFDRIREYTNLASGANYIRWVFTFDEDDVTMNNSRTTEKIRKIIGEDFTIGILKGGGKIAACNAHVNENLRDADVVMLVSDDMVPEKIDWDEKIAEFLLRSYPDLDGAVHINDGLQGSRLCTLSCMGRKFYDRFGYFYHPDYQSCFCDDEFTTIAWGMRKMVWCPDVLIRHQWVGNTVQDELHQRNHNLMARDQKVYNFRKQHGFPRETVLA